MTWAVAGCRCSCIEAGLAATPHNCLSSPDTCPQSSSPLALGPARWCPNPSNEMDSLQMPRIVESTGCALEKVMGARSSYCRNWCWIWIAFSFLILVAPPPEGFMDTPHLIQPSRSSTEHVRQPGDSFGLLVEYFLLRKHIIERLSTHKRITDRQIYH